MPRVPNCTAQRASGSFCDAPTMEGSPFPICLKHAQDAWLFIESYVRGPKRYEHPSQSEADRSANAWHGGASGLVYYIQVGDRVKIGFTTNIRKRVSNLSLKMADVIAVEPGTETTEFQRHQQFEGDRIHSNGEWFTASDGLMAHTAAVRAANPDMRCNSNL